MRSYDNYHTQSVSQLHCVLQETLTSPHLLLRRAAVSCLRQLSTREAREVSEHALTLAGESRETRERLGLTETGLEGALFAMLDQENDRKMMSDVQDTLISMLQALAAENLRRWLTLIKDVLQASTGRCQHLNCSRSVYFCTLPVLCCGF